MSNLSKVYRLFLTALLLVILSACGSQSGPQKSGVQPAYAKLTLQGNPGQAALVTISYEEDAWEFLGLAEARALVEVHKVGQHLRVGVLSAKPLSGDALYLYFRAKKPGATLPKAVVTDSVGVFSTLVEPASQVPPSFQTPSQVLRALNLETLSIRGALPEELEPDFIRYPLGDVNQDGRVRLADSLSILRFATGQAEPASGYERYHSDLNSSGTISTIDALIALRKAVNPDLEANLELAPLRLNLNNTNRSALILVGNSGNQPLPGISVNASQGLQLSDVTPEGAHGLAFRVEAAANLDRGSILFDAGSAGIRVLQINAQVTGCPDPFEPNNGPSSATPVQPGTLLAGICTPGDQDFYQIQLSEPKVLTAEIRAGRLSPSSPLDSVLEIWRLENGDAIFLGGNDDLPSTLDSKISVALPAGSYLLSVRDYSGWGSEEHVYTLSLSLSDPVSATFEAQAGTLVAGDSSSTFSGNLFLLAAYRGSPSAPEPLPYAVYLRIQAPNGASLEGIAGQPYYGEPGGVVHGYLFVDFDPSASSVTLTQRPERKGQEPSQRLQTFPFQGKTRLLGTRPQAALGGTFTIQLGTQSIQRTVDLTRKLPLPENVSVRFTAGSPLAQVTFDPVPGATRYAIFVDAGGCSVIAEGPEPTFEVQLSCTPTEGAPAYVEAVAFNWNQLLPPPLPVPSSQMDASDKLIITQVTFGNTIRGTVSQALPNPGPATAKLNRGDPKQLGREPAATPNADRVLVILEPSRYLAPTGLDATPFGATVKALAAQYSLEPEPLGAPGLGLAIFRTRGQNPEVVAHMLRQDVRVKAASPDLWRYPLREPNDPLYTRQWPLWGVTYAPTAWEHATGSPAVTVAVLDTGMGGPEQAGTSGNPDIDNLARRGYHPDLLPNLIDGYDFVSCVDVSGYLPPQLLNTYPRLRYLDADDQCGPDPFPIEEYELDWRGGGVSSWGSHGTHVAGTIGAEGNNGLGVSGVNWQVAIQPIRVLGTLGGFSSDILLGALYAAGEPIVVNGETLTNPTPARIINMSLGGRYSSEVEEATYEYIFRQKNVLVVAAAGNSRSSDPFYPAAYPAVMAVSSVDFIRDLDNDPTNGEQPGYAFTHLFSNYGPHIDIAAPGGICWQDAQAYLNLDFGRICNEMPLVLSTVWQWYNENGTRVDSEAYGYFTGTSMAAPHVAGAAALLLSINPNLTAYQLRELLRQTAADVSDQNLLNLARPGRDDYYGWGVLNLAAAVEAVRNGRLPQHPVGALYVQARPVQGGNSFSTTADSSGMYILRELPEGIYEVTACLDVNGNGSCDPGEPRGQYPEPVEARGLRDNISFTIAP